jgi:hypothetical protein
MPLPPVLNLASLEAVRPVFLIVMGVSLMMIAWRLCKEATGWDARAMMAGALLLGFGYTILMPLYEAGKIERVVRSGHFHGDPAVALAWHAVKLLAMNGGWLLFGLGLALHAQLIRLPSRRALTARTTRPALVSHESAA